MKNYFLHELWIGSMMLWWVFTNHSVYRYWNDRDVLKKLGEGMGFPIAGDTGTSAENIPDEEEDVGNEDESIVHHTASVGDVEV